jgi:hypothetical protein
MPPQGETFLDAAHNILKEAGRPMHYSEVARIALERNSGFSQARDPIESLGGVLYSEIKRGSNQRGFVRLGDGYFGLAEWSGAVSLPAEGEHRARRLRQTERPVIAVPPDITLEKLERIRHVMSPEDFRSDWGALYDRLTAEERARWITVLTDRQLAERARSLVQRIHDFLQSKSAESPKSEIICDWIFLCYTLELYREAVALWRYINQVDVNEWQYQRTAKLSAACRVRCNL